MAHRTVATPRRPHPHEYDPDPAVPGCCRCGLLKRNALHDPAAVAARAETADAQERHRRRAGDI
jgi:hypothetical protein